MGEFPGDQIGRSKLWSWAVLNFSAKDVIAILLFFGGLYGAWFTVAAKVDRVEWELMRDRRDMEKTIGDIRANNSATISDLKQQNRDSVDEIKSRLTQMEHRIYGLIKHPGPVP